MSNIIKGLGQDARIYYQGQNYTGPYHDMSIGDAPFFTITDGDCLSIDILTPGTAVKVTAVGQNYLPVAPAYRFLYTERDVPATYGTDQYCNARIRVDVLHAALTAEQMPQPIMWMPIDRSNVNDGYEVPTAGNKVLMLKRAFIYENAEDLDTPHGPWASIGFRAYSPNLISFYNDDFAAIQAAYCEVLCPFSSNFPVIWPNSQGGIRLPGTVYSASSCWVCPTPTSEWIDGPWGAIYSDIPVYDWDKMGHPDEITLLVREGDETNLDDFMGAKYITRDMEGEIFFPLWMGGWVVLMNEIVPETGHFTNIDLTDKYWFPDWDGYYPDANGADPINPLDQYWPLKEYEVPFMELFFPASSTVGLLGGSLLNGLYSKPMTYIAPCEPAVSRPYFGVQLFEHPNYGGDSRFFTSDKQNLDRNDINFADVASSIKVFNIQGVTLYDGEDYGGNSVTITENTPNLDILGWGVGSLMIHTINNAVNPQPPVAKVAVSDSSACIYMPIQIFDASLNDPTEWEWSIFPGTFYFLNNTNRYSRNPVVEFSQAGEYTIHLTVRNNFGWDGEWAYNIINVSQSTKLPVFEDFEQSDTTNLLWAITSSTDHGWSTFDTAAFNPPGVVSASLRFHDFNPDILAHSMLESNSVDLTCYYASALRFKVAYRQSDQQSQDALRITVNDYCTGEYLGEIYNKCGQALATGPPVQSDYIPSDSSEWRTETISLDGFAGNVVSFRFEGYYGGGNNLFIDDISLTGDRIIADFTVSDTFPCRDTVFFYDLSEGLPVTWDWDFGDNHFSNLQNPYHVYSSGGLFDVRLRITKGNAFNNMVALDLIEVRRSEPGLSITTAPLFPVCPATPVVFTANPVDGGDSPQYQWFINGDSIIGENGQMFTCIINDENVISCMMTSNAKCLDKKDSTASCSIAATLLEILQPPENTEALPSLLCQGEISKLRTHDHPPQGNQYYNVIWFTDGCGVTAIDTGLTVFVSPSVTTTYYVYSVNDCGSTVCDSITVNVVPTLSPPDSIHTTATNICEGTEIVLTCFPLPPPGCMAKWYRDGCNNTLIGTGDSIEVHPNSTTTYFVRFQNSCDTTSCVSITITVFPSISNPQHVSTTPSTICAGSPTLLTVTPQVPDGYIVVWYSESCGGIQSGTGDSVTLYPIQTTNYFVRFEGICISGCKSRTVTVNQLPSPPVSASSNPTSICSGDNATLTISPNAPGGYSTKWYTDSCGLSLLGTGNHITVSPDQSTTYFARYEGICGNTSCTSVDVSINTVPIPAIAEANPSFICPGMNSVLSCVPVAPSGYQAKWYKGGCGSTFVGSGNTLTVNPVNTTNYFVRFEGECGYSSCASTLVTISSTAYAPSVISASPPIIENGQSSLLHFTGGTLPPGATANWYVNECGNNTPIGTGNDIYVNPSTTTTYYVRFEGPCNTTACINVIVTVINP